MTNLHFLKSLQALNTVCFNILTNQNDDLETLIVNVDLENLQTKILKGLQVFGIVVIRTISEEFELKAPNVLYKNFQTCNKIYLRFKSQILNCCYELNLFPDFTLTTITNLANTCYALEYEDECLQRIVDSLISKSNLELNSNLIYPVKNLNFNLSISNNKVSITTNFN